MGFIDFPCLAIANLIAPLDDVLNNAGALMDRLAQSMVRVFDEELEHELELSVLDLMSRWKQLYRVRTLPSAILRVTPPLAARILLGAVADCHVVGVGHRLCRRRLLFRKEPPTRAMHHCQALVQQRRSRRERPPPKGR